MFQQSIIHSALISIQYTDSKNQNTYKNYSQVSEIKLYLNAKKVHISIQYYTKSQPIL